MDISKYHTITVFSVDSFLKTYINDFIKYFENESLPEYVNSLSSYELKSLLECIFEKHNIMIHGCTLPKEIVDSISTNNFLNYYNKSLQFICAPEFLKSSTFKNQAYLNFFKLHTLVWKVANTCIAFSHQLFTNCVPQNLLNLLGNEEFCPHACISEPNVRQVVYFTVDILFNIIMNIPLIRPLYRSTHMVNILKGYLNICYYMPNCSLTNKNFLHLRTICFLHLGPLLYEHEYADLASLDHHIVYLFEILNDCSENVVDFYSQIYSCSADKLLYGLCHFAGYDLIKQIMLQNGATKLVQKVFSIIMVNTSLKEFDTVVQYLLEYLWMLLFVSKSRNEFAPTKELIDIVRSISTNIYISNKCMFRAQGILWTLYDYQNLLHIKQLQLKMNNRLIVCCESKSFCLVEKLSNELKRCGMFVWIFTDCKGSFESLTLDTFQRTSGLVIAISHEFKNTAYCRQIVRNAYFLRLPIYIILLEPEYCADGWLGYSIATIIYTLLTNEVELTSALDNLLHQIDQNIKADNNFHIPLGLSDVECHKSSLQDNCLTDQIPSFPNSSITLSDWSMHHVTQWLTELGLSNLLDYFKQTDGKLLIGWVKFARRVPKCLEYGLTNELHLNSADRSTFIGALESLFDKYCAN